MDHEPKRNYCVENRPKVRVPEALRPEGITPDAPSETDRRAVEKVEYEASHLRDWPGRNLHPGDLVDLMIGTILLNVDECYMGRSSGCRLHRVARTELVMPDGSLWTIGLSNSPNWSHELRQDARQLLKLTGIGRIIATCLRELKSSQPRADERTIREWLAIASTWTRQPGDKEVWTAYDEAMQR